MLRRCRRIQHHSSDPSFRKFINAPEELEVVAAISIVDGVLLDVAAAAAYPSDEDVVDRSCLRVAVEDVAVCRTPYDKHPHGALASDPMNNRLF